eukprot:CAMPEP_0203744576 /NCGR_PEP_ID=MMETSP0098-20131031/599_1 /ASSEMBLY_ACC=CAM_ASM_000208 /TAXON_ID=96639 /ORGANISM=" , Strain NY0313808BC1" /LENGTH=482 /DNA_ID=CAMNT_0050632131 /DNA_START=1537 /DNA_END=2981 /DNA_ORIENTATION=+
MWTLRTFRSNRNANDAYKYSGGIVAVAALAGVINSFHDTRAAHVECHAGEKEVLRDRVLKKLAPIREKNQSAPSVKLGVDENTKCKSLSFIVPPSIDSAHSLSLLIRGLQAEHDSLWVDAKDRLEIVFGDGTGSVAVQEHPNGSTSLVLYKDGEVTDLELDSFVAAYEKGAFANPFTTWTKPRGFRSFGEHPEENPRPADNPVEKLESLGAVVYQCKEGRQPLDWDCLAGYDSIKEEIEDSILLGLKHPDEYDNVTHKTRVRFESNRPRAILFEGPPGTGKTTTARIIAELSNTTMVYIPIESVMSKWFGESETRLSDILKICDDIGAIVFLDEIDSLATSRDGGNSMHEATRRILSVLLRTIEGFHESTKSNSIIIAATNRKQDLDTALVSRFDISIMFPLPTAPAREAIFARYAKHLTREQRLGLANACVGFSGRDIKDTCKHAERRWVSYTLREASNKNIDLEIKPPPLEYYTQAIQQR